MERNGETVLPFTIQAHHAVADGYHCHLLFEQLNRTLERPEEFIYVARAVFATVRKEA